MKSKYEDDEVESELYIENSEGEDEMVILLGRFEPGTPEERYDSEGLGTPAVPACVYDIEAFDSKGNPVTLTPKELEKAEEILLARALR